MSAKEREVSLAKIKSSKSTRVILISFKAGSTGMSTRRSHFIFYLTSLFLGLNLTACNNVILVDLWWNPALEVRLHEQPSDLDTNLP